MTQFSSSFLRRFSSNAWLSKLTEPVWVVRGRNKKVPVVAIVPAALYGRLQKLYGPNLERLPALENKMGGNS